MQLFRVVVQVLGYYGHQFLVFYIRGIAKRLGCYYISAYHKAKAVTGWSRIAGFLQILSIFRLNRTSQGCRKNGSNSNKFWLFPKLSG